jgi:hypothetical protein
LGKTAAKAAELAWAVFAIERFVPHTWAFGVSGWMDAFT